MRLCIERSNDLAPLPPFPSWLDCTTNTSGYDFWKGQAFRGRDADASACFRHSLVLPMADLLMSTPFCHEAVCRRLPFNAGMGPTFPAFGFGRALLFLKRRHEWSIFWSTLCDEQGKRSLQIGTIG
jgi:hypothetical protein